MKLMLRTVFALVCAAALAPGQTAGAPAQVAQETAPPATPLPQASPDSPVAGTHIAPSAGKASKIPKGKTAAAGAADDPDAGARKPYVIGSLDVLQISVWGNAQLTGIYEVGPDGMISMQLIGQFKADGLTQSELTAVIKQKLTATVMDDPEVNVQLLKNNSKKYYIYGGCARNGEFPLMGETTVMDAFANCGGFREFANLKKTYLLRGDRKIPFNYKEVSQGKHMEQNIRLQNGDRIFVPDN